MVVNCFPSSTIWLSLLILIQLVKERLLLISGLAGAAPFLNLTDSSLPPGSGFRLLTLSLFLGLFLSLTLSLLGLFLSLTLSLLGLFLSLTLGFIVSAGRMQCAEHLSLLFPHVTHLAGLLGQSLAFSLVGGLLKLRLHCAILLGERITRCPNSVDVPVQFSS